MLSKNIGNMTPEQLDKEYERITKQASKIDNELFTLETQHEVVGLYLRKEQELKGLNDDLHLINSIKQYNERIAQVESLGDND